MKKVMFIYLLLGIKGAILGILGFVEAGFILIAISLVLSWYVTHELIYDK